MIQIRVSYGESTDHDDGESALNEEGFEILKNITKELLFSGSKREIKNNDGNTARDLF